MIGVTQPLFSGAAYRLYAAPFYLFHLSGAYVPPINKNPASILSPFSPSSGHKREMLTRM